MEKIKKMEKEESKGWKIKKTLSEMIIKGALTLNLLMTPMQSHSFYNYYPIFPKKINMESIIEKKFEPEKADIIKKIWNTHGKNVKDGVEYLIDVEAQYGDIEKIYDDVTDMQKFYIVSATALNAAEYYTFIDNAKKEQILLFVKGKIKEEIEKDKYNIDLWELLLVTDKIIEHMYGTGGPWNSRDYEIAKETGKKELTNVFVKWERSLRDYKKDFEELKRIYENKETRKQITDIFGYSKRERKNKLKELLERFEWEMFYVDSNLRNLK